MSGIIKPRVPILDWNNPLTKGLVLDVLFIENGGSSFKDLITQIKGSAAGSAVPLSKASQYGRAMQFDATDDLISFTSNALHNSLTNFSIEALVYIDSEPANDPCIIVKHTGSTSTAGTAYWALRWSVGVGFRYFYLQSGWATTVGQFNSPVDTIVVGNWYHVIVTYKYAATSDVPIFYVNGKSVAVVTTSSPAGAKDSDDTNLYIGNRSDGARPGAMTIPYVRLWNRILLPRETSQLYQNPFGIYKKRKLYAADIGSSVTVQPSVLSAVFSTQVPTAKTDAVISSSVQSGALSLQALAVSGAANIPTATQSAIFSIQTPAINFDFTVQPSALVGTFNLQASTVKYDFVVAQTVQQATFSLVSPAVSVAATALPTVQEAVFSFPNTSIITSSVIAPTVQTAAFSVAGPAVASSITAVVGVLAASFSNQVPTVKFDQSVVVPVQAASFLIQTPSVGSGLVVGVNVQSASFSLQSPAIKFDQALVANVMSSIFSINSVAISISATAQALVVSAIFTLQNMIARCDWTQIVSALQVTLFSPATEVVIVNRVYPYNKKTSPYSSKNRPYGRQSPYEPLV